MFKTLKDYDDFLEKEKSFLLNFKSRRKELQEMLNECNDQIIIGKIALQQVALARKMAFPSAPEIEGIV